MDKFNECHWLNAEEIHLEYSEEPVVQAEIWRLIHQVICQELTERQRLVVKLMVFDEVPNSRFARQNWIERIISFQKRVDNELPQVK